MSLWEIAHRWHGAIPNSTDDSSVTREVRDTLLALIEQVVESKIHLYELVVLWSIEGEERHSPAVRRFDVEAVPQEFHRMSLSGVIQRDALQAYSIDVETIFRWYNSAGYTPPDFCIPEWAYTKPTIGAVAPAVAESKAEDKTAVDASVRARKAALKRHEPIQKIKGDLYAFWDAGEYPSQAECVRRFMRRRSEESLRPLSPTNAERTLKEALTKHLQSKRKR